VQTNPDTSRARVERIVPQLLWILGGAVFIAATWVVYRVLGRTARTRAVVLEEVRRSLKGGVVDRPSGRGEQARGRLGELEITVELQRDPLRPRQSPMWRVLAIGPVAIEPVEARVDGWEGWIDPWLQLGETLMVPRGIGPDISLHAEHMPDIDHPVVAALRRQGDALGAGALHARPDLMRVETVFQPRPEDNRPLFAYLQAMMEISEVQPGRPLSATERSRPRVGIVVGGK
jgi:hypothetical protein